MMAGGTGNCLASVDPQPQLALPDALLSGDEAAGPLGSSLHTALMHIHCATSSSAVSMRMTMGPAFNIKAELLQLPAALACSTTVALLHLTQVPCH